MKTGFKAFLQEMAIVKLPDSLVNDEHRSSEMLEKFGDEQDQIIRAVAKLLGHSPYQIFYIDTKHPAQMTTFIEKVLHTNLDDFEPENSGFHKISLHLPISVTGEDEFWYHPKRGIVFHAIAAKHDAAFWYPKYVPAMER